MAYNAAISGGPRWIEKAGSGSLAWLIARYRSSVEWANLSAATRRQRENILLHVINSAGSEAYQAITRRHIKEAIDRRRETPFAANNFLKTMRGLFRWAHEAELIASDPSADVKGATPRTNGFPA
jgi:site-specific recombinase XerD